MTVLPNDPGANATSPWSVLTAARKAVPAVDYALGVAGVAAAGALLIGFLGNTRAAVIVMGGMFVAMVLLYVFARLVAAKRASTVWAGVALLWMVVGFFGAFLAFTVTAFALSWPAAWVEFLGLSAQPSLKSAKAAFEIPKAISDRMSGLPKVNAGLVRLQPASPDAAIRATRESLFRGGGAYYSFSGKSYSYDLGSDIELENGSVVIAWRTLKAFDTPITTGTEDY